MLKFEKNHYTIEEVTLCGETVRFRAFRDLVYVEKPVNVEFQKMNLFVPESYYEGTSINGYDLLSAPVFMPNTVGGYMPGPADEPGANPFLQGKPNTIFRALQHGYVVASPAIRGRVQKGEDGHYNGKAPACVVDYKAAVRYLHFLADELPGDENKIITNGTSAGGALSSLMGSTGNHPDYEPYLQALGAADAGDDVFAASCYCPIINLEHADMAYEWEFCSVNDFHRANMKMDEGGRPVFTPVDGEMTEEQIRVSVEEKALFPAYVSSLGLKDENGAPLTLDADGEGSLKEYVKHIVMESAQRALDGGVDLADKTWLTIENGKVTDMDLAKYAVQITRLKAAPAFDALDLSAGENSEFGSASINARHFTAVGKKYNTVKKAKMADKKVIGLLNPLNYIGREDVTVAPHWRIRHGSADRDTSLAVPAILALRLQNEGYDVNFAVPWGQGHGGDYDLDELFAWADSICR